MLPKIATIGYEGHTPESFLNLLIKKGVTILCDVRRNPISRKHGFSKRALAKSCGVVGIIYQHLSELGIPSEQRRNLNTQEDYDALFAVYKRDCLVRQEKALEKIRKWIDSDEAVAIMCYEQNPAKCHRHCVAQCIADQCDGALILHL